MKKTLIVLAFLLVLLALFMLVFDTGRENGPEGNLKDVTVSPISHATMVLSWGGITIYTDPTGGEEAFADHGSPDLVLLTDIHGDHLNVETLEAVVGSGTTIVAPQAVADMLSPSLIIQTVVMNNDETISQSGFSIEAIPMYNLPAQGVEIRHEKGRGNGYVLERENVRVYIAGDTAGTPEMRALENIDIAFVPMNLPFTMSVEEAADATLAFAPRQVYPFHYRGQNGLADTNRFKELVNMGNPDIEVILRDWYPDREMEEEADVVIDLTGKNFEFSVEEIKVAEGDTVTINFTSESGFHDWVVDKFEAATDRVETGDTTSVTFVADEKGTFEYYCSVGEHRARGMVGDLVVE